MAEVPTDLTTWLRANPLVIRSVSAPPHGLRLIETATGRHLTINQFDIVNTRLTPHPQGFGTYLNLVFATGVEIVLCHAGIAFSPDLTNTGPLPDAPPVVSWSDYSKLINDFNELMKNDQDRAHALLLFQVLIAIVDGARRVGFDVSTDERTLEDALNRLESGKN